MTKRQTGVIACKQGSNQITLGISKSHNSCSENTYENTISCIKCVQIQQVPKNSLDQLQKNEFFRNKGFNFESKSTNLQIRMLFWFGEIYPLYFLEF